MTTTNLPAQRTANVPATRTPTPPRPPIKPFLSTGTFIGLIGMGLVAAFLFGLLLSL